MRVGPNELSFATEDALKAIHNPPPGQPMFTKKGTIESLLASLIWSAPNLLGTHDKATHKRLRNALQPAFTAKALLEQESISQYHIGKEVEKMLSVGSKDPKSVLNLSEEVAGMIWDIVGDLSFGEPLQRHQRGKNDESRLCGTVGIEGTFGYWYVQLLKPRQQINTSTSRSLTQLERHSSNSVSF